MQHTLVHRILVRFGKSEKLCLRELRLFLAECQVHYHHALIPKEKAFVAGMVRRYMESHSIGSVADDEEVASMAAYLDSLQIRLGRDRER